MDQEFLYKQVIGRRFTKYKWMFGVLVLFGAIVYDTPFSGLGLFIVGFSVSHLIGIFTIENMLRKNFFVLSEASVEGGKFVFHWKGARLSIDPEEYPVKWIDKNKGVFSFTTGIAVCSIKQKAGETKRGVQREGPSW